MIAVKKDLAKIVLISPVCTMEGEKIALSRRVEKHWRLIGWGQILRGKCDWCGVVWCGVVWCGVVWCGVVWCGVVTSLSNQLLFFLFLFLNLGAH